jgi:uncharacterized repeat protein (TIGR01451 family)
MFEANQGQADAGVNFVSIGDGSTVSLRPTEITLMVASPPPSSASPKAPEPLGKTNPPAVLRVRFLGASEKAEPKHDAPLLCKVSDYAGADPKQWHLNIPTYAAVHYQGLYGGIDVAYHGTSRELEYDFSIAPRIDPKVIRIAFEGADNLRVDEHGDLVLSVRGREMFQRKPVAYQGINGERKAIEVRYMLNRGNQLGLLVSPYDTSKPLVIDPVLSYATLSGDVLTDYGNHIAVDLSGNAYVAGRSSGGLNFDALVAKYDPSGAPVYWHRFHGNGTNGDRDDFAFGIALDGSGNIYVVGTTASYNFPTTSNAFSTQCGGPPYGNCNLNPSTGVGQPDAFIMKLDATGTPLYSSFFGGPYTETANAIAVDGQGMVYITGGAIGGSIPLKGGFPSTHTGGNCSRDAYVAKFDPSQSGASSLVFSTQLGGDGNDEGKALAVVPGKHPIFGPIALVGSVYVAGITGGGCTAGLNAKFPTTPGAFAADGGLTQTAFITLIDPGGTQIQYSSVLPGTTDAFGVATNLSRNGFITGSTSGQLPVTTNAFQTVYKSGFSDAYVARFDPTQSGAASLVYATYLGGGAEDRGNDIAVDFQGRATVTGMSRSTDFPVTSNAIQSTNKGGMCGTQNYACPDVFVTRLNSTGSALDFSTYLGGTSYDEGMGVALGSGNLYVTGKTSSSDFPATVGTYHGNYDVFVARITLGSDLAITKTVTPDPVAAGQNVTYTVQVTNNGPDDSPGVRVFDAVPGGSPGTGSATLLFYHPAQGTCTPPTGGVLSCDLGPLAKGASTTVIIVVQATGKGALRNAASVQGASEDPVPGNNMTSVLSTVTATADLAVAINQTLANPVGMGTNVTYTVQVSNNGPDVANQVELQVPISGFTQITHTPAQIVCSGTSVLTCDIGTLVGTTTAGTSAQILTFTLAPATIGTFTNTATVSGNADDPNPANDSASVTTQVIAGAPQLDARVEDLVRLSASTVRVVVQFRNVGTSLANNISMTQAPVQLVAGTGAVSLALPALPYALGNLAVGGGHVNVTFIINAPVTVKTVSLNEIGTMQDFSGNALNFSLTQSLKLP